MKELNFLTVTEIISMHSTQLKRAMDAVPTDDDRFRKNDVIAFMGDKTNENEKYYFFLVLEHYYDHNNENVMDMYSVYTVHYDVHTDEYKYIHSSDVEL